MKKGVRPPQANAHCERFIGTPGASCLYWMIPLNGRHPRRVLAECMRHYISFRLFVDAGVEHSTASIALLSPLQTATRTGSPTRSDTFSQFDWTLSANLISLDSLAESVTVCVIAPSFSCHASTVYVPGGTSFNSNFPSPSVTA